MHGLQITILFTGLLAVHTQWYESLVNMTPSGFEVQPLSPSDLLTTFSNVMNMVRCVDYCNQQQLCRFFDQDIAAGTCRIFSNGLVVPSTLMTSQAGTVDYEPSLYVSYGQPCTSSNCQANRYLICGTANTCKCPTGLVWNTPECVVTAVPPATPQSSSSGPLLSIVNPTSSPYPAYTPYSYAWTATGSSATLSFFLRHDPSYWLLDDITVYHGMTQLIINGGFETGDLTGWTYSGGCGSSGGLAQSNIQNAHTGSWYYYDGCTYMADELSQMFPTIAGDTYIISFWLTNDGCCSPIEIANITIF